jgi:hypothetical protein
MSLITQFKESSPGAEILMLRESLILKVLEDILDFMESISMSKEDLQEQLC